MKRNARCERQWNQSMEGQSESTPFRNQQQPLQSARHLEQQVSEHQDSEHRTFSACPPPLHRIQPLGLQPKSPSQQPLRLLRLDSQSLSRHRQFRVHLVCLSICSQQPPPLHTFSVKIKIKLSSRRHTCLQCCPLLQLPLRSKRNQSKWRAPPKLKLNSRIKIKLKIRTSSRPGLQNDGRRDSVSSVESLATSQLLACRKRERRLKIVRP